MIALDAPPNVKVLVVDDDGATRLLARRSLEQVGFKVVEAKNGNEAIKAFSETRPDLIMMDVMMPGIDGLSACEAIRAQPEGHSIPIIMVTALDDLASIQNAYEAGATDFITKPIKWATLHQRVRYMVRQKVISDRLRESEARLAKAQRIAKLGNWEWDIKPDRLRWSDEVYAILNLRPYDFDGTCRAFLTHVHPDDRDDVSHAIESAIELNESFSVEYRIVSPTGEVRIVHQEAELEHDKKGKPVRLTGTIQDITEQSKTEDRLRYLAHYDPLTSLPNRHRFTERLKEAVKANRKKGHLAVLAVGLDRFKRINGAFGHEAGDELLRDCALRLVDGLEQATANVGKKCTPFLARFGGDEFIIILENCGGPKNAAKVADDLLKRMADPFDLGEQEVFITTSIGICLHPNDGDTADGLIHSADAALRHAKAEGKNNSQTYTSTLNADAVRRFSLESKLQKSLENDELMLLYQPKVEVSSGRLVGMEALIRWQHPELGTVSPLEFISLAEESGLIVPIGEWVLREACTQSRIWRDAGYAPAQMSVNLSARQFWDPQLAENIGRILVETGIEPHYLELEITEGTFMQNAEETVRTLKELKKMDVNLSVDDFGTGYSSLSYLQKFPLDTLKVDRSFVSNVTTEADSAAITRTIISMARSLNLTVIAEGVETEDQLDFMRKEGCDQIQGYLVSPPVTSGEFEKMLRQEVLIKPAKVRN